MSHLDEGTLHALLDNELANSELMEIEAHLDGCNACSARLRAAREFLDEADRLVGSVQFGRFAGTAAPVAAAASAPPPKAERIPVTAAAAPRPREPLPAEDVSPVLLIPDNPEASPLLSRWPRIVGWAASITFAVSAGYLINNLAKETTTPAATPTAVATAAPATTNNETDGLARSSQPLRRDSGAQSTTLVAEDTRSPAAPPPAADKPIAAAPAKPAQPKPDLKKESAPSKGRQLAGAIGAADSADEKAKTADAVTPDDSTDAAEERATREVEQEAIRAQAAKALTQLDRQRRANRAAAATAALDRAEALRLTAQSAPAPAPPPPTVEQRTQVYLRIGLDEASRQLGGPVHVIEGMSPLFMGLAPGRASAGADTTRPVVRVVYQDPQGRLITLDQQRSRPGQPATPGASGSWSLGDLTMRLSGEAPTEVLRSLRARVR
ncbi:MAG TPA: zf-HC2 domain-containing protein [Gemmatimonadales bacterium]|jgi:hypothetical protein